MTDHELDLSYRVGRHPEWLWVTGMLGIKIEPDSLYQSDLHRCRYFGTGDFSGYSPSLSDTLTVHLIWEQIKKFNLKGYSLLRVFDSTLWKAGFKKGDNKPVLLFSSSSEGNVAVRSWLWFAARKK